VATGISGPEVEIATWPRMDGVPDSQLLFDWVTDDSGNRPRLCLLRGAERAGKSRLLAWFLAGATSAGHPRTTVHATVPARGLTTDTFAWELGRQLGYGPLAPNRLLNQIAIDQRRLLILIPDLHRAGRGPADLPQAEPTTLVDELVEPLLALPHVRMAVEVGDSGMLDDQDAEIIAVSASESSPLGSEDPVGFVEFLAAVPRNAAGRPDWAQASTRVRDGVLDQALDEGGGRPTEDIQWLLSDPGFLVYGSARAITAAVADVRIPLPEEGRSIWRRAAPQLTSTSHGDTERAALLHAAALGANPRLAMYLGPLAEQNRWTGVWSRHDVPAAAVSPLPEEDNNLLLVANTAGRLMTLDAASGTSTASVVSSPQLRPRGIAARDSRSFLLLDENATLHHLAPPDDASAEVVLSHITEYHGSVALTSPELVPTALSGSPSTGHAVIGDSQGYVHLWPLHTYQAAPRSSRLHREPVIAAASLHLADSGRTVVVSAALDGSVRLWETASDPMPTPVDQRPALVTALACADTAAGALLAVAWNDAEVHVWHLASGRVRTMPLLYRCTALTFTSADHLTVAGPDGIYTLRLDLDRLSG
jgi:hypothetical protein